MRICPCLGTAEENNTTAAHASRKWRPKWVPCAWGFSCANPAVGFINTVNWPSRLGGWATGRQADNLSLQES